MVTTCTTIASHARQLRDSNRSLSIIRILPKLWNRLSTLTDVNDFSMGFRYARETPPAKLFRVSLKCL